MGTDKELLRILQGDALDQLRTLPDESVHCCVTSPPYWGLRDYGTASWKKGDAGCDHLNHSSVPKGTADSHSPDQQSRLGMLKPYAETCRKCGAKRIDSQLGLEKAPEEYVAKMVQVFREVRRVLRKDGTLWLNLGDSYAAQGGGKEPGLYEDKRNDRATAQIPRSAPPGLKPKDLCGIPWRVAFALQADGWYLRQDIIWAKPNPMPESVTDRCTKAHEYLFLLTKSARYFYDAEAIKDPVTGNRVLSKRNGISPKSHLPGEGIKSNTSFHAATCGDVSERNKRSVWTVEDHSALRDWLLATDPDLLEQFRQESRNKDDVWHVATSPYPEAHFATYPPDLIKPCILAGTSAKGCCAKCGAPWERIVEKTGGTTGKSWHNHENDLGRGQRGGDNGNVAADAWRNGDYKAETTGWQPTCECFSTVDGVVGLFCEDWPGERLIPCTVLDPFAGSGTTGQVALELGRKAILIELNPRYAKLITRRCDVTPGLALAI